MKINWYYSLIFSILALVGASQIEFSVPNQELIVDFSSEVITATDAEIAIAEIKTQLENVGATNIKVAKQSNGLRITYYSTKDVAVIKTVFSQENMLFAGKTILADNQDTETPIENDSFAYQLQISELKQGSDLAQDFNGQLVKTESTTIRFFNPFVYYSFNGISLEEQHNLFTTALKINKEIALAIAKVDYVIPEVRAGPKTQGFLM